MRNLLIRFNQSCLVLLLSGSCCVGKEEIPVPDYAEVLGLVRSNMVGATEEVLNEAALNGLLSELGARVALVTGEAAEAADSHRALDSIQQVIFGKGRFGITQASPRSFAGWAISTRTATPISP